MTADAWERYFEAAKRRRELRYPEDTRKIVALKCMTCGKRTPCMCLGLHGNGLFLVIREGDEAK